METKQPKLRMNKNVRNQRGITLLEYAAGAAVILAVLYVGFNAMGEGVNNLLNRVGSWATTKSTSF